MKKKVLIISLISFLVTTIAIISFMVITKNSSLKSDSIHLQGDTEPTVITNNSSLKSNDIGYEKVMNEMFKAIEINDFDKYNSYLDKLLSSEEEGIQSSVRLVNSCGISNIHRMYGENIKINYIITKSVDMLNEAKEKNKESIIEKYLESSNVKDATELYFVSYEYTITGDKGSDSGNEKSAFALVDGEWYPLNSILLYNYYKC